MPAASTEEAEGDPEPEQSAAPLESPFSPEPDEDPDPETLEDEPPKLDGIRALFPGQPISDKSLADLDAHFVRELGADYDRERFLHVVRQRQRGSTISPGLVFDLKALPKDFCAMMREPKRPPPTPPKSPPVWDPIEVDPVPIRERIEFLERELQDRLRMDEAHPRIPHIRREIAELQKKLRESGEAP
jgi:hypothetical protein